ELFDPKSVAVIGASPKEGKVGNFILQNLAQGFQGEIYPINPSYDKIMELKCYPSIQDAPQADLAVIAIPAEGVTDAVKQCGKKGTRNVVVISAGFKETGKEGSMLERELVRTAEKYGINLVGPNCLGIINTHLNLNATFSRTTPPRGDIAFLSQSGAFILAIIDWAISQDIGFSKVVSLGNEAVLDESDFIDYLEADNQTKVIIVYLEGIKNGSRFIEVARKVAKKKPIIVMKSGKTDAGARAASSHTGSIAGSYTAFQAAFQQSKVVQADSIEEIFDYSLVLSSIQEFEGKVGIITNSGGPGVMAADAIDDYDLELASFHKNTIEGLREALPPEASIYNPVDILGDADAHRFGEAIRLVERDDGVDGIITILTPTAQVDFEKAVDYILDVSKPVLTCFMGGESVIPATRKLKDAGIVNFLDPGRALRAFSAVNVYDRAKKEVRLQPPELSVDKTGARKILQSVDRSKIVGSEAFDVLQAYGITTVPQEMARTAREAQEMADRIGYPVVMKVVSPDIIHKSDVGCVKVNVDSDSVKKSFFDIIMRAENIGNARIDGVMIQKMIEDGQEIIVGVKRDPQFGPLMMFGMGGIYVEIFRDVSFRIAPINKNDAQEMIKSIKAYPVLRGVRGGEHSDIDSLTDVLLRVSRLSVDFPEIMEMDINPIKVFEKGYYAIDFKIIKGVEEE
ncbi:MAG: acetate--CoA ligase alpha subunit, partial [Halobacteriota archaeon]